MEHSQDNYPYRAIENTAMFGVSFALGVLAMTGVDRLYHPNVTDLPQGVAMVLGLAGAGLSTVIYDRLQNRNK